MPKRKFLAGAVVLVAVAGAGGAYAATQSGSNPRQAFTNDLAKRLNVSPAKLRAALKGALLDRLQAAVKAGRLTQAQANRIKQRIEQGGGLGFGRGGPPGLGGLLGLGGPFGLGGPPDQVRPPGLGGPPDQVRPPGLGLGHGRFGAPGMDGRRHGPLSVAARYLGVSEAQLLTDLRGGKTLAQVAKARGKSVAGLEQALASAIKSRLDRIVAKGFITKAQEQRVLKRLSARIAHLAERARPHGPPPAGPPAGPARGPALAPPPPGA